MGHAEWEEIRNGEMYFVDADKAGSTWVFTERSSFEIRWFRVAPKPGWIRKAERLANCTVDDPDDEVNHGAESTDVECGDFCDNASVLAIANWKIKSGAICEGLTMLRVLQSHILRTQDPKSQRILLSAVEAGLEKEQCSQSESQNHSRADGGNGQESIRPSRKNVSQFKLRLVEAVGLVTALSWTHSLVVHEIMTLPGLNTRPTGANLVAGSLLAVVLRFVSRGGRV
jgi:hypothetical protein